MDAFLFYNILIKNVDLFLQGFIYVGEVKERRPEDKNNPKILKSASFVYDIIVRSDGMKVCMKAFLSIFSVSEKRVRRNRDFKMPEKILEDKIVRGISTSLASEIHEAVHDHIRSFSLYKSHYSKCGNYSKLNILSSLLFHTTRTGMLSLRILATYLEDLVLYLRATYPQN